MREIVFDTETTGFDPFEGHRIIEIGCVELINHVPTGRTYQQYINPERSMSEDNIAVHGLTEEFLSDKPVFREIVDGFLEFIGSDSMLIAHNASFDMKFLNAELSWLGYQPLAQDRVIDTLIFARKKFPGKRNNLDELCKRFQIDNSNRTFHGALLDSELLADVYLELLGGREPGLVLDKKNINDSHGALSSNSLNIVKQREYREPRAFSVSEDELKQHIDFVQKLKNNLWGF